ncbi:MAG: hypothetical protein IJZ68_07580 [Bacteroidaceae bacterium]|nr:hypothetical protein [Bacteroidaceae bacterium]
MQKNRYKVYQIDHVYDEFGNPKPDKKTLLRVTSAVSEKQAINNVRFTLNIRPSDLDCAYRGGGGRRSELVAEMTHTSR